MFKHGTLNCFISCLLVCYLTTQYELQKDIQRCYGRSATEEEVVAYWNYYFGRSEENITKMFVMIRGSLVCSSHL